MLFENGMPTPIGWVFIGGSSAIAVALITSALGMSSVWPGVVVSLLTNTYIAAKASRMQR